MSVKRRGEMPQEREKMEKEKHRQEILLKPKDPILTEIPGIGKIPNFVQGNADHKAVYVRIPVEYDRGECKLDRKKGIYWTNELVPGSHRLQIGRTNNKWVVTDDQQKWVPGVSLSWVEGNKYTRTDTWNSANVMWRDISVYPHGGGSKRELAVIVVEPSSDESELEPTS